MGSIAKGYILGLLTRARCSPSDASPCVLRATTFSQHARSQIGVLHDFYCLQINLQFWLMNGCSCVMVEPSFWCSKLRFLMAKPFFWGWYPQSSLLWRFIETLPSFHASTSLFPMLFGQSALGPCCISREFNIEPQNLLGNSLSDWMFCSDFFCVSLRRSIVKSHIDGHIISHWNPILSSCHGS